MYILIDNYDSFSYNVYHLIASHTQEKILVIRNDALSIQQIKELNPKAIIISPGPCAPKDAGICVPLVKELKSTVPIFGICLGMQAIGEALGAQIVCSPLPVHGKVDMISHQDTKLLKDIPSPTYVTRYHSLCLAPDTLPDQLIASAFSNDQVIQAIYHQEYPLWAVQFHPESIRTKDGHIIIKNFLRLVEDFHR